MPVITKYCSEQNNEHMRKGHFRIGTLRNYASGELEGGLMEDLNEGLGAVVVKEDLVNFTGQVGNLELVNVSIIGFGDASIHVDTAFDMNVFCAASGAYSVATHEFIRNGGSNYSPNPDYTAHIELDQELLITAIQLAARCLFTQWRMVARQIKYGERSIVMPAKDAGQAQIDNHQVDVAFIKPLRFQPENEFRVGVMSPNFYWRKPEPILTSRLYKDVQQAFVRSVL